MKTSTKYIDLTTDFAYKRIFGTEANKDLLITFINDLFQGRKIIKDLSFNKNEHVGNTVDNGTVIFDLLCTAENGEQFLVEVQRSRHQFLKRRMLYYGSKLISDQAPAGNRAGWNYQVNEVFVIVLMDDCHLPNSNSKAYYHEIALCNLKDKRLFDDTLGFLYIELINFTKKEEELSSDLDHWLYILKHISSMDRMPTFLHKNILKKLFNLAEYSNLNKEDQAMYDVSLKRKWDAYAIKEERRLEKEELKQAKQEAKQAKQEAKQAKQEAKQVKQEAKQVKQEAKQAKQVKEEAKQETQKEVLIRLINRSKLTDQEISEIMDIPVSVIQELRKA